MKFVLATHNPGKLKEMADILSGLGVEVVSPAELGIDVEVEETGSTFAENAMLKARAICDASGLPAAEFCSGDLTVGEPALEFFSDLREQLHVHLVVQKAVHLQHIGALYLSVSADALL